MTQYIDKSALVAEIRRRKEEEVSYDEDSKSFASYADQIHYSALDSIQEFINSLKVKEVDLDKEIDDIFQKYKNGYNGLIICNKTDFSLIAKYFFELGLRSTITEEDCKLIWNIGDEIPNMPEEEFFKELLKRFKAQKGEEL